MEIQSKLSRSASAYRKQFHALKMQHVEVTEALVGFLWVVTGIHSPSPPKPQRFEPGTPDGVSDLVLWQAGPQESALLLPRLREGISVASFEREEQAHSNPT